MRPPDCFACGAADGFCIRAASSSVFLTERERLITSFAASSCFFSSAIGTSARACPAERLPFSTSSSTPSDSDSSRSEFVIAGRERPTLFAASSCVMPYTSISVL